MSKQQGGFYCLNCIHTFATEIEWESHKKKYIEIKIVLSL